MKTFIIILSLIAFLFIILIANAVKEKLKAKKLSPRKAVVAEEKELEYAQMLSKMIQCATVSKSDTYDDTEFLKLRQVIEKLFPLVHSQCEKMIFSEDCWVFKLKGKDQSRNIMLMSHHDVVEAEGEWEHPPFSGEICGGVIWGRGTVDTKTPLFAEFRALEELLGEGFVPPCNVYIASSHNEETSGDGIPLALEYFKKENICFEAVLDEGGAIISPPLPFVKNNCAMMAVHENGRVTLNFSVKQDKKPSGFATNKYTPVLRMSAFIHTVSTKNIFKKHLYPETKSMLTHISPYAPLFMSIIFSNLWFFGGLIKRVMPKLNPQAASMVSTTCTFNDINMNKAEKLCTAKAFIRPVNEADYKKELEKIKEIADKFAVTVEETPDSKCYRPADITSPQFQYAKTCVTEIYPDVIPAPYILPAGTDARHLTEICPCVIRFAPIEMNNQQFASVHNANENMSLESIGRSVAFYKHYLKNYK